MPTIAYFLSISVGMYYNDHRILAPARESPDGGLCHPPLHGGRGADV